MSRTRITFIAILATFLTITGISLAWELLSSGAILQLYIATSIFGVSIIALDFLGIFGEHHGDGDSGDVGEAGDFSIDDAAHAGFELDFEAGDGPGVDISHTDFDGYDASDGHTDGHFTDWNRSTGSRALSFLAYLRLLVYFSVGFGPTGWVAVATGRSPLVSLLLASGVGIVSLLLAQAMFRFQQSYTDSSLATHELLSQEATVTIPLSHREMGKVRIQVGMNVTEQYALASNQTDSFKTGDKVLITRVSDECVYVA